MCGQEVDVIGSGGSLVANITSPIAQQYNFGVYLHEDYCLEYVIANFSWSLSYNGSVVSNGSGSYGLVGSCFNNDQDWTGEAVASFVPPYYSSFNFHLGTFAFPGITLTPYYDHCVNTAWSPYTDPVTLTITSGSQYASFHSYDPHSGTDTKVGPSITTVGDSISNLYVAEDGVLPDTNAQWIIANAVSNGITKTDSLQIPGAPIVTITPPEISVGDTATIQLKWQNPPGGFVDSYEAGIISDGYYGTLLRSDGDTAAFLGYVPMPFQFIAANNIDTDSVKVEIRVGVGQFMLSSTLPGGKGDVGQGTTAGNGPVRPTV